MNEFKIQFDHANIINYGSYIGNHTIVFSYRGNSNASYSTNYEEEETKTIKLTETYKKKICLK